MTQIKHYPAWNEVVAFGTNGPAHKTLIETDSYKAVLVGMEAGVKIPPHPAAAAAYHFLDGSGWMVVEGERMAVRQGETVVVPAGVPRGMEAETRMSFLGSHGVAREGKRRPILKMGLPMILGAVLMFGLMIGLMVAPAQMMSRIGGMGLGMWGVMLIPLLGMGAMMIMMFIFYRRMMGGQERSAMGLGHAQIHARPAQVTGAGVTTLTFNLPSVHCGNCKRTVEQAVGEIQGVTTVQVEVETKQATVNFEDPATQAEIEAVLAEIGHPSQA